MRADFRRGALRRLAPLVLVVLACAAGAAYATTQLSSSATATSVIQACANNENGNLRIVSGPGDCRTQEHALQWNVVGPQGATGPQGPQGQPGLNGQSVTSVLLAANDPNCLFGGAQFRSVTGQTYACNGAPGKDGANGTNGHDGTNGTNGTNGRDGANGTSVTAAALAVGDANCPFGGSRFTSAAGDTYACNGAPGKDGQNGRDGVGGGLASFDSVTGLPCSRDGQTGTIAVSYAGDGTATLKCNVAISILTDVHNCGAVGHDVSGTYANATATCVNGAPQFGACLDGFANWNGDLSDGCELALTPDALEPDDTVAQAANYPSGSPIETISPAGEVDVYNMGAHSSCHTTASGFVVSSECSFEAPTVHSSPTVQVTFLDANGHPVSGTCGTSDFENTKTGESGSSSTCTSTTIDNMHYIEITSAVTAAYTID